MLNKNSKRSRHKVSTFPKELIEAINKKLVEGKTYEEITEFINEKGFEIGKSSVGRYGKDFLSKLESLKVAKEQARALVEEVSDRPATEMHEAANQMAIQLIIELFMKGNFEEVDDINKLAGVFKSLSALEKSAVAREKLKFDVDKGVRAAFERIKAELREELAQDEALYLRMLKLLEKVKSEFNPE